MIKRGDRVQHVGDEILGTVVSVDDQDNYFWINYGVTTCRVLWDDCSEVDIQWINKLIVINRIRSLMR